MQMLILRLEAPLLSFGAPVVDHHGVIQPWPARSMLTGLLGNALGYDHRQFDRLERLQERLSHAVRQDKEGEQVRDYQRVDLSQPFMRDDHAWTTLDKPEKRKGGSASTGIHLRDRYYWADAIYTIALTVDPPLESPTINEIEQALKYPARPLFLGRKPCLPSSPIFRQQIEADNLVEGLRQAELANRANKRQKYRSWWPMDSHHAHLEANLKHPISDGRDWANQIHAGQRWIAEGELRLQSH